MTTKRKEKSTNIGNNVARIRALIGIDQGELAGRTGMSRQEIIRWENTLSIPDKTLSVLANGLGVPITLIRNYAEAGDVYHFQHHITVNDHGTNHVNYRPAFHYEPLDKLIELLERWMTVMTIKMEELHKKPGQ